MTIGTGADVRRGCRWSFRWLSPFQHLTEFTHHTLAKGQYTSHEHQPGNDRDPGAERIQVMVESGDDGSSHGRAKYRIHTTEQGHQDDVARGMPVGVIECGELEDDRFERTRDTGETGGDGKHQHFRSEEHTSELQSRPHLV